MPWLVGLAAVALIGAVFLYDDALVPAPQMAENSVIFPDGTALSVQKYEVTVAEWNVCQSLHIKFARCQKPDRIRDASNGTFLS